MRAIVFILAGLLLSVALLACQYVEVETEPTAESEPAAFTEATPDPVLDPTPEPTPEPTPATDPDAASAATPEPTLTPAPTATPEPDEPEITGQDWMQRDRLTVLLAGSDAGAGRVGARMDTMMVVSLDIETGRTTIFSVPRNYGDIPLPDDVAAVMGFNQFTGMLNSLYGTAQNYPGLAPDGRDPGMVALTGAISELLGLHIDYYAMVDMAGFIELVDAFGGVHIEVAEPLVVLIHSPIEGEGWHQFEIAAGDQTLDGRQALAYARSRTGTSDYDRMERQRCLVQAVTDQADLQTLLTTFPDLVDVIRERIETDVPLEMLPDMIMLRDIIDMDQVISYGFTPPNYLAGQSSEGHNLPAYDNILNTVRDVLEHPERYLDQNDSPSTDQRHC